MEFNRLVHQNLLNSANLCSESIQAHNLAAMSKFQLSGGTSRDTIGVSNKIKTPELLPTGGEAYRFRGVFTNAAHAASEKKPSPRRWRDSPLPLGEGPGVRAIVAGATPLSQWAYLYS
jgi:hypothetical protein